MAEDLKSATPDASFPSGAVLFGADSQAAASPSVYAQSVVWNYWKTLANTWTATQTITPEVNTNALAVTGYSLTGSNASSLIDLAGTWNTSGTPTALKLNVTDTASNASSLLMDLQVGGSSRFGILKDGTVYLQGAANTSFIVNSNGGGLVCNNAGLNDNTYNAVYGGYGVRFSSSSTIGWSSASTVNVSGGTPDLFLLRRAAANLQFGNIDAAAPVAQTLSVQSVVAGTSNTAGANLTITGSQGTGTGAGGSIIFQVAPAGSTGTAQNALARALAVTSGKSVVVGDNTAALATTATDGFLYVPTCAGTPTGVPTAQTGTVPIVVDTTNNKMYFYCNAAWRDAGP